MKMLFPVVQPDGKDYTASELLSALSLESSGYYLLSRHQFWHGGVHLSNEQFPQHVSAIPVRAIADGEVVAWRVNDKPELVSHLPGVGGPYEYSTGFCLIRHTFTSPEKGPTAEERMRYWEGREIEILQDPYMARNVKALELQRDEDFALPLEAGTQVRVVSVDTTPQGHHHWAQIATQQAYTATNRAGRSIDLPVGQRLWLPLFNSDGQPASYGRNKSPVFRAVDHDGRDTLIALKANTPAYCYPDTGSQQDDLRMLPAGTKIQIYDDSEEERPYALAMLLHDVPARDADNRSVSCTKGSLVRIECFDAEGQWLQRDGKPLFEKTPTSRREQYTFEFYSLYMHLCPYRDYPGRPTAEELTPTVTITRSGIWARNKFVRESDSRVLGQLSRGAKLQVLEKLTEGNGIYLRAIIQEGSVKHGDEVTASAGTTVWVLAQEGSAQYIQLPEEQERPEIIWPVYWQGTVTARPRSPRGMAIYADAALSKPIGTLSGERSNTFTYDTRQVRQVTVNGKSHRVAPCAPTGELIFTGERQPRGAITSFWANVDHDTVIKDDLKPEFRKVHTDRVTPIKAGDPIGYLGIYQIPDDDGNAYSRQQMHFEIFTPDSEMVDYLLNNPLGLTRGKQYLRLTKGMVLVLPGPEGHAAGSYPLRFDHAVPLEGLKTEEHDGKTWYLVDVEGRSGYIEKTDNLEIVSQHDGAKLGFQIMREDDPNHNGFLDPELISGVFLEIYKAIDADGNRQLSVEELVAAKDNPVLKEVWSKLIAYHPTEWRNHNGTARRFSDMLTDPDIPPEDQEYCRNLLPQELVRMQMLSFWDRLNQSLPESSYYFHPVRFVEFAATKRHPVIIIDGKKVELEFLELNDGEPISEEEYANIAASIGCEVAVVKAVAKVESGGQGPFFNFNGWDRVPTILFERHIFHRYTNGIYSVEENRNISHASLSNRGDRYPRINGYWESQYQYKRLLKAYALDKKAALMSASWGRFQLMGFNYQTVPGVTSVEDMVRNFGLSERWHFKGFLGYIRGRPGLGEAMINKNWTTIARLYNGKYYGDYDIRIRSAYNAITNNH